MKIFIDDERYPLRGEERDWVIVRDPVTALAIIRANAATITHISFDNDLGYDTEGRTILSMVLGTPVMAPMVMPRLEEIRVHSANTVANKSMIDLAQSAQQTGTLRQDVRIEQASALYTTYPTLESWYDDAYEGEKERLAALTDPVDGEMQRLQDVEDRLGVVMDGNGTCKLP